MLSGLASMMVTRVATIAAGAAGLVHDASLDDAAAMFGNFRIEKLAARRFEAFERASSSAPILIIPLKKLISIKYTMNLPQIAPQNDVGIRACIQAIPALPRAGVRSSAQVIRMIRCCGSVNSDLERAFADEVVRVAFGRTSR